MQVRKHIKASKISLSSKKKKKNQFESLIMAFRLLSPKSNNLISVKLLSITPARELATATPTYTRPLSAAGLFASGPMRNDWTRKEIKSIYDSPTMDLLYFGVS